MSAALEDPGDEVAVPLALQVAEVERELKLRGRSYPRLVEIGSMEQRNATRHMQRMRAVLVTLRGIEPA